MSFGQAKVKKARLVYQLDEVSPFDVTTDEVMVELWMREVNNDDTYFWDDNESQFYMANLSSESIQDYKVQPGERLTVNLDMPGKFVSLTRVSCVYYCTDLSDEEHIDWNTMDFILRIWNDKYWSITVHSEDDPNPDLVMTNDITSIDGEKSFLVTNRVVRMHNFDGSGSVKQVWVNDHVGTFIFAGISIKPRSHWDYLRMIRTGAEAIFGDAHPCRPEVKVERFFTFITLLLSFTQRVRILKSFQVQDPMMERQIDYAEGFYDVADFRGATNLAVRSIDYSYYYFAMNMLCVKKSLPFDIVAIALDFLVGSTFL